MEEQGVLVVSEKTGFFEESPHNKSSMRLMCFASFIASIVFAYITITAQSPNDTALFITFGFLIGGFVPKLLQKFVEKVTQ